MSDNFIQMMQNTGNVNASGGTRGLTRINLVGRDLSFQDVFRARLEEQSGLKFSAHAMGRLNARDINLAPEEITRLANAVDKASEKGVSDSLVLLDDKAFIVSIENLTVVTAMDGDAMRNNVFTNIDSTVIVALKTIRPDLFEGACHR